MPIKESSVEVTNPKSMSVMFSRCVMSDMISTPLTAVGSSSSLP